jgi:uncharacterized protein (TIGR03083 family)
MAIDSCGQPYVSARDNWAAPASESGPFRQPDPDGRGDIRAGLVTRDLTGLSQPTHQEIMKMSAASHTELSNLAASAENAAGIAPISRTEARSMGEAEVDRFLALVESLGPDDWSKPTACTLWDVSQILAHQAGAYAGYVRWSEFRRQFGKRPARGQLFEDALSATQVADRAHRAPAELIAEFRQVTRPAIANRHRIPALLRWLGMPHPDVGFLRLGYLLDIIYTRDTWMHRLDISRATGRAMVLTREHDGRLVALVVRDLARSLAPKLGERSVVFELTGPVGAAWRIGPASIPTAAIHMDTLDFNILASGRYHLEEGRARASMQGDLALAELALRETKVLY